MLGLSLRCCLLTWVGAQPYWVRGSSSSLRCKEPVPETSELPWNRDACQGSVVWGSEMMVGELQSRVRNPDRAAWSLQQAQGSNSILALDTRLDTPVSPVYRSKLSFQSPSYKGQKYCPFFPRENVSWRGDKKKKIHHDKEKGYLRKCHEDFLLSVPGFPSDRNDCYLDVSEA